MESPLQRHERLLSIIEDNTRREGLEPTPRMRLENIVGQLRPGHINGILAGTVYTWYDPDIDGLRSRDS
jgi:hypothetical protein